VQLSVVICTFNGAEGLARCLDALASQVPPGPHEIIVVDDGSTDASAQIAADRGARVVRHAVNRGLAQARNTGVRVATGSIVAFVDDDCEPAGDWACSLLAAYDDGVVGVGGPIEPRVPHGYMGRFLQRNNPLQPFEENLADSDGLGHRLLLYLRRQWLEPPAERRRAAPALVGANMSFRRAALAEAGLFDAAFVFGADDIELGLRLTSGDAARGRLVFDPRPRIAHHFRGSLRDTLRRSRGYGRGAVRLYRRRSTLRPAVFPLPLLVAGLLALGPRHRGALAAAAVLPQAWFLRVGRRAAVHRRPEILLDAYILLLQEAAADLGVVEGFLRREGRTP
jgi:glycosyltransferase involved in cell wall biosynthesis